jgi:alanine racemase
VEVRAGALRRNLESIRDSVGPGVALIPMVKADAYGIGVAGAIRVLDAVGPWGYGVATVDEGLELRELGVTVPVVVFSPVPPGDEDRAVAADLQVSISELAALDRLIGAVERVGRPAGFHVEVDTGMGRSGLAWESVGEWGPGMAARASDAVHWVGCFTHFHSADTVGPDTAVQWGRFSRTMETLKPLGAAGMIHACNSPGALREAGFAADAVRPGIFLYGGVPGQELPAPEPVVSVRARVTLIKNVPVGATVGYGATHVAETPARWATLGIGYGDGLPRALSNRGHAALKGERVPIIGRISMDVTVVDITGVPDVEVGDVATLFGPAASGADTLEEVAGMAGTINYEILTGLTRRLPRVWVGEDDD